MCFISYEVLCHCEERSDVAISRKGSILQNPRKILYNGHRGILCTRGEKEYASKRQLTVACDNRLVKREAYDAGEKSHTSKSAVRAAWKGNRVKNALTIYVKFIINKPNKHRTVLKANFLIQNTLNPDTGQFLIKKMVIYTARVSY